MSHQPWLFVLCVTTHEVVSHFKGEDLALFAEDQPLSLGETEDLVAPSLTKNQAQTRRTYNISFTGGKDMVLL